MTIVAGCSEPPEQANGRAGGEKRPPALVEVASAVAGPLQVQTTFLGRVRPAMAAEIAAAVEGHVETISVREGDRVKRGAVLLRLDGDRVRAELRAARASVAGLQAELAAATRQQARIASIPAGSADLPTVSDTERDSFQLAVDKKAAELEAARASVERLTVEVAHHNVSAPFAGVIRARYKDPGDWISVGERAIELLATDAPEVLVDVSVEVAGLLTTGAQAFLRSQEQEPAIVVGLVPALDPTTKTVRVRLVPVKPADWLLAGLPVDVAFPLEYSDPGVVVPRDAVIRGQDGARVIKAVGAQAVFVPVVVVAAAEEDVLVQGDGLGVNDQVIVRGNERLQPGQPIKVVYRP